MADDLALRAMEFGATLAGEVLDFRAEALVQRQKAILEAGPHADFAADQIDAGLLQSLGTPASAGVVVAEGDSWFDYPWTDVLRVLEDDFAYDVQSVAHKGDRVEDMAYSGGELEEFTRELEKQLRRNVVPRAILLSGGGNDIAGDEFAVLLNHARSPHAGFNQKVLEGIIDERLRFAYITILSAVTKVSLARTGKKIRILIHGYDYPVPDGRGFMGGWWIFPGPWLEPGFRSKGYGDLAVRIRMAGTLIDRFNEMLATLPTLPEFDHVVYVDLRGTLSNDAADYKGSWANELHPTGDGFRKVGAKIAAKI